MSMTESDTKVQPMDIKSMNTRSCENVEGILTNFFDSSFIGLFFIWFVFLSLFFYLIYLNFYFSLLCCSFHHFLY